MLGLKGGNKMRDINIKKRKNRSIGVTVLGWYFILQGWIAWGQYSEIGIFALIFVALSVCIGIGILKLLRAAYIGALLLSGFILVFSLITFGYSLVFVNTPFAIDYSLGLPLAGILVGGIIIFLLTRKGVKEQFDKENDKNFNNNADEEI